MKSLSQVDDLGRKKLFIKIIENSTRDSIDKAWIPNIPFKINLLKSLPY